MHPSHDSDSPAELAVPRSEAGSREGAPGDHGDRRRRRTRRRHADRYSATARRSVCREVIHPCSRAMRRSFMPVTFGVWAGSRRRLFRWWLLPNRRAIRLSSYLVKPVVTCSVPTGHLRGRRPKVPGLCLVGRVGDVEASWPRGHRVAAARQRCISVGSWWCRSAFHSLQRGHTMTCPGVPQVQASPAPPIHLAAARPSAFSATLISG